MKKLIGTLALAAVAGSAFAQGTINVANGATSLVQQWANAQGSSLQSVAANNGKVQFLAAPDGTAFKALGTIIAGSGFSTTYSTLSSYLAANPGWNAYNVATVAPVAGRFSAGVVTVSPLTPGGKIEYSVIGWTGTAASYDAAYTAFAANTAMLGQSPLYTGVSTGDPTTTPAGAPGATSTSFTGMTLAPPAIPEPTTFALLGLGAAAMLIFRRK